MSLKRAQSFRFDVMRNKVGMLYAPVEIIRGCNLEKLEYALPKLHEDIIHATYPRLLRSVFGVFKRGC